MPKAKIDFHSDTMCYDRQYIVCHIRKLSIHWVWFLLLVPPVSYVRYPKCAAYCHCVGVVIILDLD
jgi:hypothetical protein